MDLILQLFSEMTPSQQERFFTAFLLNVAKNSPQVNLYAEITSSHRVIYYFTLLYCVVKNRVVRLFDAHRHDYDKY